MSQGEAFDSPRKFYFSDPVSGASSRASSPALSEHRISDYEPNGSVYGINEKSPEVIVEAIPGVLPDEVYDSALAGWRAGVRRLLVRNLKAESRWLAAMQARVRSDWLDTYFVYTSSLGTHTSFMALLPAVFFFGHEKTGRGLVTVLGLGVYCSSFVKDLICSPRPFAPPVTRLTMGTHHLEYGFPSTHSTNSASIALYLHTLIYRLYLADTISATKLYLLQAVLVWYLFSIVYGRLYCAMHSFTDCLVGVALGAAVWAAHWSCENYIDYWLSTSRWSVPLLLIFLAILMINRHPQPIDDCPCFEDSIAFVSTIMGVMLGKWHAMHFGLDKSSGFFTSRTPGSDGNDWNDWTVWLGFAGLKLFVGILSIFVWRLVAKAVFHAVLPPTFRFFAHMFTLPNRRFYTPATDYEHVPAERGLHPIPSVIDLPQSPTVMAQTSASLPRVGGGGEGLKLRNGGGARTPGRGPSRERPLRFVEENPGNGALPDREGGRKHYDADVLTKVMVYVGIGLIASEVAPVLFEVLGWGVVSG